MLAFNDSLILIYAEGHYRDIIAPEVAPGLNYLAERAPAARFVPLATKLTFWDERRPNLPLRFGEPSSPEKTRQTGGAILADALSATMDAFAADAASRNSARFTTLLAGKTKINPFYDGWRRAKALVQGRRFDPAHRSNTDTPNP